MGQLCSNMQENQSSGVVFIDSQFTGCHIQSIQNNICEEDGDLLINPSNIYLDNRYGVSKNIIVRGGQVIQKECSQLVYSQQIQEGECYLTGSGDLAYQGILHIAYPMHEMDQLAIESVLRHSIQSVLTFAHKMAVHSIVIPLLYQDNFYMMLQENFIDIMLEQTFIYLSEYQNHPFVQIKFVSNDNPVVRIIKDKIVKYSDFYENIDKKFKEDHNLL